MSQQPNVLFIVIDDLNAWIGALGRHPDVRTPHIDALAEEGVLFTHAYCTAPHCNPSRTSVFTGLRPTTTGVYHGEQMTVRGAAPPTLPERLRAMGYRCFGTGKVFHGHYDYASASTTLATHARWNDSHNDPALWDEFHVNPDEPLPEGRPLNKLIGPGAQGQELQWFSHFDWGSVGPGSAPRLADETVCERAAEFLGRSHDAPFFCAVGLYRPHLPWYVPERFFDLYPLDQVTLPQVRDDDLDDVPPIPKRWAREIPDHERILESGQWRHAVQGYLASVSFCDEMLGRLMASLREAGRDEDTLVVLWSDNGFHLGEKLHWRKFTLWEEATRVPLILRVPGGASGRREDHPVSLLDVFPTVTELCGGEVATPLEGRSLAQCATGRALLDHPLPIATWGRGNHSVRSARWRYTRYSDGSEELYDHDRDPYEWTNLAMSPGHEEVMRELGGHLEAIADQERANPPG